MAAQYINQLANDGASFTNSFAITHPSQPNYLALFSGSTHGIPHDRCPISLSGDNLASELRKKGMTFAIYSESMPVTGYRGCQHGQYFRKHNPAVNWQDKNIPRESNMPFEMFPSDYSKLPTVSIVVPNQTNDMHDGATLLDAIIQGDRWLRKYIDPYVQWATKNNSLLILTWDEDDGSSNNQIATIFVGPMVKPGTYPVHITHYNVLRTIVEMYGLTPIGHSAEAKPVVEIWKLDK
jgi:acid phosphatase